MTAAVSRLVLVRQAMPDPEPDVPAERWHLGAEGEGHGGRKRDPAAGTAARRMGPAA